MKFCTNALLEGGTVGELGDCGLFIVNAGGCVALLVVLVGVPLRARWKDRCDEALFARRNRPLDTKPSAPSDKFRRKILTLKLFYAAMVVLSVLVFAFSVLEKTTGYAFVVNYLSVFVRIGGWTLLSHFILEFLACRGLLLMIALCWGTCQVATAGMSSIQYQLDTEHILFSVCNLFYFILSCLFIMTITFHLLHKTEMLELSSPLLYCNSTQPEDISCDKAVDREDMNSLFIKQQRKQRVTYDAPCYNDDNQSVSSSTFGSTQHRQTSYPHSVGATPTLQRTGSLRSVDLSSDKNVTPTRPYSTSRISNNKWSNMREQFLSGFGNDMSVTVLNWEFFVLNEKNRIALYRLDIQDSKNLNSQRDDISLPEGNAISKRHDEILFLREKLAGCFPNVNLPKVPVPPLLYNQDVDSRVKADDQTNVEFTKLLYGNIAYNLHLQEMNTFLSALLAHKIVGQKAYAELRHVDSLTSPTGSYSFLDTRLLSSPASKITNIRESQVSIDDVWDIHSTGNHGVVRESESILQPDPPRSNCIEIPPFGHLHQKKDLRGGSGISTVHVSGVTEGEALPGSNDKLFFLIEATTCFAASSTADNVKNESRNSIASEPRMSVSRTSSEPSQRRTVKKKYKQLLSLNNILSKSSDKYVVETSRTFPALSRNIDGQEHRMSKNELIRELDRYISAIYSSNNPHTPILLGFLESDIQECSSGYDMIFQLDLSSDVSKSPKLIRTIDTDTKSFKQRVQQGHLRSKLFVRNDGKVLNESSPPLNSLGANWVEEVKKANDILSTLGSDKLKVKEKRTSITRESALEGISGFSASSNITTIVSDCLVKLTLLVQHVGGARDDIFSYQDEDPTEFLQRREVSVLNWRSTSQTSEVISTQKSGEDEKEEKEEKFNTQNKAYSPDLCGLWLSQWRLRRAILSTTAFGELSIEVSNLKALSVKQLKNCSDGDKLAFLINLYNLISLHATILLPWPNANDVHGRCRWQALARYQIGDIQLSLLQIEHALFRSQLVSNPLPSIPQCFDIPVPSPADIKHLSSLLPKSVDVRVLMALSLPFRSSTLCHLYSSFDGDHEDAGDSMLLLQRELFHVVSAYLLKRIKCFSAEAKVVLPKILRRSVQDILLFRKSYEKAIVSASPQGQFDDQSTDFNPLSPQLSESYQRSSMGFSRTGSAIEENRTSGVVGKSSFSTAMISSSHDLNGHSIDINEALKIAKDLLKPSSFESDFKNENSEAMTAVSTKIPDVQDVNKGDWEIAADKDMPNPRGMVQQFSKPYFGDKLIAESEFQQLRQILASELKINDRTYHFKTYPKCFLGSDAVTCLSNYMPGGSCDEAIAVGNNLIEYGVMRHVVDDHWLKAKELFYSLGTTSTTGSGGQMTPYLSFILHHISDSNFNFLSHQLSSSDDMRFSVLYVPEDFRFKVPLPEHI